MPGQHVSIEASTPGRRRLEGELGVVCRTRREQHNGGATRVFRAQHPKHKNVHHQPSALTTDRSANHVESPTIPPCAAFPSCNLLLMTSNGYTADVATTPCLIHTVQRTTPTPCQQHSMHGCTQRSRLPMTIIATLRRVARTPFLGPRRNISQRKKRGDAIAIKSGKIKNDGFCTDLQQHRRQQAQVRRVGILRWPACFGMCLMWPSALQ